MNNFTSMFSERRMSGESSSGPSCLEAELNGG